MGLLTIPQLSYFVYQEKFQRVSCIRSLLECNIILWGAILLFTSYVSGHGSALEVRHFVTRLDLSWSYNREIFKLFVQQMCVLGTSASKLSSFVVTFYTKLCLPCQSLPRFYETLCTNYHCKLIRLWLRSIKSLHVESQQKIISGQL